MPFPAFLLRCLLALALVAGGVPTFGMANAVVPEDEAAMTACHEMAAPHGTDSESEPAAADADCCGSTDCRCDCLQHMPAAALTVWTLASPEFPAIAPSARSFEHTGQRPTATLRPPIA